MQTLNDFQTLLGNMSHLWPNIGIEPDEMTNLNKALDGDQDLNSARKLSDDLRGD